MKIQCDVCSKDEASVFCIADEAALCDTCDHRVHHANKLASKHQRFSLLHPSVKNSPLCDVCQEKRAFLFCLQDRAILCRDCDVPIHKANEHTQKHDRFLLTGVKLSATSTLYMSSSPVINGGDLAPDSKSQQHLSTRKHSVVLNTNPPSIAKNPSTANNGRDNQVINEGIGSISSISEYLMETLPGWHVEDFFDFPYTPSGFSKTDDEILPSAGADLASIFCTPFPSEAIGIWVPQSPLPLCPSQHFPLMGLKETNKETAIMKSGNNKRCSDDAYTVPQVSPPSIGYKRSSPFCYEYYHQETRPYAL